MCVLSPGLNVVGRGSSSQADHDGMLDKWKTTYPGMPVHGMCLVKTQSLHLYNNTASISGAAGVFLQNSSISSSHAAICKSVRLRSPMVAHLLAGGTFLLLLQTWKVVVLCASSRILAAGTRYVQVHKTSASHRPPQHQESPSQLITYCGSSADNAGQSRRFDSAASKWRSLLCLARGQAQIWHC